VRLAEGAPAPPPVIYLPTIGPRGSEFWSLINKWPSSDVHTKCSESLRNRTIVRTAQQNEGDIVRQALEVGFNEPTWIFRGWVQNSFLQNVIVARLLLDVFLKIIFARLHMSFLLLLIWPTLTMMTLLLISLQMTNYAFARYDGTHWHVAVHSLERFLTTNAPLHFLILKWNSIRLLAV